MFRTVVILRRALLVLLLLVALALVVVWWRIDAIAESAIEQGGTQALGVRTSVGLVLLRPLAGALSVTSVSIANPPGYDDAFLEVGGVRVDVELGTLLEDTVVVPRIAIDDVDVVLERRLRESNYGAILANLSKGPAEPQTASAEGGAGVELVVRELVVSDVQARVRLVAARGVGQELTVRIPEIRLSDVGSRTRGGVVARQLVGTVVTAILQAVLRESGGLPGDVAGELRSRLARLERVPLEVTGEVLRSTGQLPERAVEDLVRDPAGALKDPGKAVEDTGEAVKDAAQDTLRGLLGGKKEEGEGP